MGKTNNKKYLSAKDGEQIKKRATDLKVKHVASQQSATLKKLKSQGVSKEGIDEFIKFFGQCMDSGWDGC